MTGATILLLEDDPAIRWLVGEILEQAGYEVHSAADLDEARSIARLVRPDAVVVDRNLPDGDGLELLREPSLLESRFMALTVRSEEHDIRRSFEHGVHAYVVKPFDPLAVVDTVRRLIDTTFEDLERARRTEIERSRLFAVLDDALAV